MLVAGILFAIGLRLRLRLRLPLRLGLRLGAWLALWSLCASLAWELGSAHVHTSNLFHQRTHRVLPHLSPIGFHLKLESFTHRAICRFHLDVLSIFSGSPLRPWYRRWVELNRFLGKRAQTDDVMTGKRQLLQAQDAMTGGRLRRQEQLMQPDFAKLPIVKLLHLHQGHLHLMIRCVRVQLTIRIHHEVPSVGHCLLQTAKHLTLWPIKPNMPDKEINMPMRPFAHPSPMSK